MVKTPESILGIDVGETRIGLAIASSQSRLPRPLTTLQNDEDFFNELVRIIKTENISTIIVGLPRGMSGQRTKQTDDVEAFADKIKSSSGLAVYLQDEAVTSAKAEAELKALKRPYRKEDIDKLAATYILEDWLNEGADYGGQN